VIGNRLSGKKAVITAAAQGIGRATAIAFANEGATVWATDVNEVGLLDLSREHSEFVTRRLDVRDSQAVATLAAETGPIDVLFNCAGYVHDGTIFECTEDDWDASFDLNVKSMFRMCRSFLPGMLERGGGSIINMSSAASSVKGAPRRFVYGATKAAVIGLTKAIAADFIEHGIRCNAICPGTVETPSLEDRMKASGDAKVARAAFVARQPMGRLGRPVEIAALAVYLASNESGFTTGQIHIIDGGWTC
jgi:2-dehydro-3-deoxy-L-fuconate 4-dehydrogenase